MEVLQAETFPSSKPSSLLSTLNVCDYQASIQSWSGYPTDPPKHSRSLSPTPLMVGAIPSKSLPSLCSLRLGNRTTGDAKGRRMPLSSSRRAASSSRLLWARWTFSSSTTTPTLCSLLPSKNG